MSESNEPVRKRRKISLACVPCRERKIRCSGEKPVCASCLRRSSTLSSECSYVVQSDSTPNVTQSLQFLFERLQRLENQSRSSPAPREYVHQIPSFIQAENERVEATEMAEGNYVQRCDGSDTLRANGLPSPLKTEPPQISVQESAYLVPNSADIDLSPGSQPSESLRVPNYEGSSAGSTLDTHTHTATGQTIADTATNIGNSSASVRSHRPSMHAVDDIMENPRIADGPEVPQEPIQVAIDAADAMGASSVCDETSPEDSTQYYGGSSGIAFMRAISKVLTCSLENKESRANASLAPRMDLFNGKQNVSSDLLNLFPRIEGPKFRPDCFALPSRSLADYLLDNYWTRAYPLYPFLHRPTFEAAYAMLWNPTPLDDQLAQESDAGLGNKVNAGPSTRVFYCALNMMFALGSQFSDIAGQYRDSITAMFEERSNDLLIVDMMDRGSIAVVQALLLGGQFLQSTFYPQRCWNSIGVACRIAQGLGLYVEEFQSRKAILGLEMRRRVWYGCIMLDMSGSMTMGRPLMISHKFSTIPPSQTDDELAQNSSSVMSLPEKFSTIGFFLEAIKLSKTLGIILTTIYDQTISSTNASTSSSSTRRSQYVQTAGDMDAVLELDKKLIKFQDELPTELRWGEEGEKLRRSLGPNIGNLEMQTNVLQARFLQTRILLYRTTFIQLCQDSVSKMYGSLLDHSRESEEFDVDAFFATRCAVSCVVSARELIKLVHRTSQSKNTDAWWYYVYYAHTSGMVINLARLCNPLKKVINASSLEESWALCRQTLSDMRSHGPVAQRCLESLEGIQEKISSWESKNSKQKNRVPQQGNTPLAEFAASTSPQETLSSNDSEDVPTLQDQSGATPQIAEHYTNIEQMADHGMPLSGSPFTVDGEKDPIWSTDLRDWWNFPVFDFGLDSFPSVA